MLLSLLLLQAISINAATVQHPLLQPIHSSQTHRPLSSPPTPIGTSQREKPCILPTPVDMRFPAAALGERRPDCDRMQSPPSGWWYGIWHLAWTSQAYYTTLYNFHTDFYPILPTDASGAVRQINLASFQTNSSDTLLTAHGIDTPIGRFVFNGSATGAVTEIGVYEWIAWGYDTKGDAYIAVYDAPTSGDIPLLADIGFFSRVVGGPSKPTRDALLERVVAFGNAELSTLASQVARTPTDGRRKGIPLVCDAACVNNTGPV